MDYSLIMRQLAISAMPILVAIVLHEVAHGYIAYKLGDPTARDMGRLTLNPLSHIDPFGTIIMPGLLYVFTNGQFVFGYAKPVPIDPRYFRNPKRDMAISAAAGPLVNILIAFACSLTLKHLLIPLSFHAPDFGGVEILEPVAQMLKAAVVINIVFAVFNLIPIPPLDGGRVLMGILPYQQAVTLSKIEPFGFIIVIILVATNITSYIIWPVVVLLASIITYF